MKKIVLALAATLVLGPPQHAFSQVSTEKGQAVEVLEKSTPSVSEEPEKEFKPKDAKKDPFKALVDPPPPVKQPEIKGPEMSVRKEPLLEPLPVKVSFVVGSSQRKFALLSLNNKNYEMTTGDEAENGLFKVIEVNDTSVKIYDSRVKKERVINLNE